MIGKILLFYGVGGIKLPDTTTEHGLIMKNHFLVFLHTSMRQDTSK